MAGEKELREMAGRHISPVITRITDMVIDRASGAKFWTVDNEEYIDFVSGVAVNALGHAHPEVVKAIQDQASRLIHVGLNYGYYASAVELAGHLARLTPGDLDTVFFANSGAESVDGAIKLARAATGRPAIIAFDGSFHGRTIGATSITASSAKYRKYYEPLMGAVYHIPYPYKRRLGLETDAEATEFCLNALTTLFDLKIDPTQVAAIIIEPVMGEGGYVPAPSEFLKSLRQVASKHGILLIFDEVQTGFGRTGKWFAAEHSGVVPDIMILAKALSSGLPLGAIVAPRSLHEKWPVGAHGSTFGGNPVACAAANASIVVIERERLADRSAVLGAEIVTRLEASIGHLESVVEIRGLGLMIGVEFQDEQGQPGTDVVSRIRDIALKNRLLVTSCGVYGQTIRLMLPLNIHPGDLDDGLRILEAAIIAAQV